MKHRQDSEQDQVWLGESPEVLAGRRIRELRTAVGWTQEQLAGALFLNFGISMHQTTIAKVEGASRPLRLNEAVAFAAVLGVELQELMSGGVIDVTHDLGLPEAQSVLRSTEIRFRAASLRALASAKVADQERQELIEAEEALEVARAQVARLSGSHAAHG